MKNLESLVGYEGLLKDIEMLGEDSTYTCLNPDIYGVDPDDGFTTVPYEKGFQLLYYLESLIGKNDFQNIMKNYIDKFKFLSIDYNGFKNVYEDYVKKNVNKGEEILKEIDWEKWINSKGKPFYKFNFESKLGDDAVKLGDKFLNGNGSSDDKKIFIDWHTNVKMYFLKYLIKNIDKVNNDVYNKLKDVLGFKNEHYNMEVMNLWFQLSLKSKHDDFVEEVKKFLLEIGRLKFVRPVFFSWYELQPKESKEFFESNKMVYHPFARRILSMKLK
jgi:leukotriene-A4 hydrolase